MNKELNYPLDNIHPTDIFLQYFFTESFNISVTGSGSCSLKVMVIGGGGQGYIGGAGSGYINYKTVLKFELEFS